MTVRTRVAPSPTGDPHVGTAYIALFNLCFARAHGGQFLLRIEDTDQARSTPESERAILDSLRWLGIEWDEGPDVGGAHGPYRQSERMAQYGQYAQQLVDAGKAEFDGEAIILTVNQKTAAFEDVMRGTIEVPTDLFGRIVLMKSDGTPAYNFACVVDDALMKISHVIRGDDHIANTPKQVIVYEALGFQPPLYVHIPLYLLSPVHNPV